MTTVTLRKSSVIQRNIQAKIKELNNTMDFTSCNMEIWNTNPNKFVDDNRRVVKDNIATIIKLREVLLKIRISVGKTNSAVGINDYLASRELIKHTLSNLNSLRKSVPQLTPEELESKIQFIKSSDTTYNKNSAVQVNLLTKEDIDFLEEKYNYLKDDLVTVEDELLRLNMTNNIIIDDYDYNYLKELHLV